jgi:glutamate formiminotransferase/formiminotetrahydrofolate cyclodeaminase
MPSPIIECISNFSEARRPQVVDEIRQAIAGVPGAHVLDQHSDLDHNRTVITFAGPPPAVEEAAFRAIARAAELINLDEHRGEHPRIGATDVVPFVPISGASMQDCVEMARRLGARVGHELDIPVYLYEAAATRPERVNLENIRRGQYEGLKSEIAANPERMPDYGPARLGTAGATVIGARHPLIAFNVYLTSEDVSIAKKIAKAVRHSSGGLRFVKGLGLLVDGRAQVSMNLTNYRETPLARVVELIRREAQRYGVGIHHTELVGLIPQEALVDAAVWYLQLDQFNPEQILEQRLQAALKEAAEPEPAAAGQLPTRFLEALAADAPTPGGGSASAYSGAAGAALVSMVARLTIGRKKYAAVEAQMSAVLEQAEALRASLTAAIQRDAQAFEAVMAAYKLPKGTPAEQQARSQAVAAAMLQAAQVPLEVARAATQVMKLALQVVKDGNLNAISDGATGSAQARAALSGAGYNVRINVASLPDPAPGQPMLEELRRLEADASRIEAQVQAILRERGGMPF